jgi:uncharacterized protein YegJ (DUF2314 family)
VRLPKLADAKTKKNNKKDEALSDTKLYALIAGVVALLAGLVWWSLPGDHPAVVADEASTSSSDDTESDGGAKTVKTSWDRPERAKVIFAILTNKPEDVVKQAATTTEIARKLEPKYCASACDAVKKLLADEDGVEIEVSKAEDLLLPGKDVIDTVAPNLTPGEREKALAYPTAVKITTEGAFTTNHVVARTGFAVAALLAEQLDGFVWDDSERRIETDHDFASHVVTAKLGEPAFVRRHILIQLYRQEDGTARANTLGMARFGSPDISFRGANMASGPVLAEVLNTVASKIAHGHNDPRITITLDDVAKVVSKKPEELNPDPKNARPVTLDISDTERLEADADNELAEIVPYGGSTRENWEVVVASLFGVPPSVATQEGDKELGDVAKKARKDLPDAIKRFQKGDGELYVKGPFPVPPEARPDGGSTTEHLWISAASCDDRRCSGILSNDPTYATNLGAGKTTSVENSAAVDWLIHLRDGGTVGGESIKVLKARATRK